MYILKADWYIIVIYVFIKHVAIMMCKFSYMYVRRLTDEGWYYPVRLVFFVWVKCCLSCVSKYFPSCPYHTANNDDAFLKISLWLWSVDVAWVLFLYMYVYPFCRVTIMEVSFIKKSTGEQYPGCDENGQSNAESPYLEYIDLYKRTERYVTFYIFIHIWECQRLWLE